MTIDILAEDMPWVVGKLRLKAEADHRARISLNKLDAAHRSVLVRAIDNVLATENAIFTYAQIIDGLPIADVAWDRRSPGLWGDHPLDEHEELCPGALDKAREVCPQWNPDMLAFAPRVINSFQQAAPGTRMFNTRLFELVAVALHQFGVVLHQLEFRMHQGDIDYMTNWTMEKPDYEDDEWEPVKPLPTIFNNPYYVDWQIYPEAVADMVGYWAEDRILGGVVVFDRRAELNGDGELTGEPPNIYLHPSRANTTFRVTQLLDQQQEALVDFLLAEPGPPAASTDAPPVPGPLPVIVDDRNRTRVSPEDSLVFRGIYRDIWERKPLDRTQWYIVKRRPQDYIDYPEIMVEALVLHKAAGWSLPEGKLKRYLAGDEILPDGPTKRSFDEYKEFVGHEKEVNMIFQQAVKEDTEVEGEEGPGGQEGGGRDPREETRE